MNSGIVSWSLHQGDYRAKVGQQEVATYLVDDESKTTVSARARLGVYKIMRQLNKVESYADFSNDQAKLWAQFIIHDIFSRKRSGSQDCVKLNFTSRIGKSFRCREGETGKMVDCKPFEAYSTSVYCRQPNP